MSLRLRIQSSITATIIYGNTFTAANLTSKFSVSVFWCLVFTCFSNANAIANEREREKMTVRACYFVCLIEIQHTTTRHKPKIYIHFSISLIFAQFQLQLVKYVIWYLHLVLVRTAAHTHTICIGKKFWIVRDSFDEITNSKDIEILAVVCRFHAHCSYVHDIYMDLMVTLIRFGRAYSLKCSPSGRNVD